MSHASTSFLTSYKNDPDPRLAFRGISEKVADALESSIFPEHPTLITGDIENSLLSSSLNEYNLIIEYIPDHRQLRHLAQEHADNSYCVVITSGSLHKKNLSFQIADVFIQSLGIRKGHQDRFRTALHEACLNAVIHGNLNLESNYTDNESLMNFYALIDNKLEISENYNKSVIISASKNTGVVTLSVSDCGGGFMSPKGQNLAMPYGRGLTIIKSCADSTEFQNGGRTISMNFNIRTQLQEQSHLMNRKIKNSRILIVDDIEVNRLVLRQIFSSHGFETIDFAADGKEAMEKTLTTAPDIIILDLMMPVMNGYDYCKALREIPEFAETPVLVQTALSMPEQRNRAFESGATDLVSKPVNPDEIVARASLHLEKQLILRDLRMYKTRVASELEAAREMQLSLLPASISIHNIESKHGVKIGSYFETSSELGGDFWSIRSISEDKISLMIADFSGHGMKAAINTFRLHTMITESTLHQDDPPAFMADLNRNLYRMLPSDQFATMFYCVIDTSKNSLSYVTAGCPDFALYTKSSGKVSMLEGRGFPLGISADSTYPLKTLEFPKGSYLFLYSDTLIETPNTDYQFMLEEDIAAILAKSFASVEEPATLIRTVLDAFRSHSSAHIADDLTMVCLGR